MPPLVRLPLNNPPENLTHVSNTPVADLHHFELELCAPLPLSRGCVLMRMCFGRPHESGVFVSLIRNGHINLTIAADVYGSWK